jgi:hypothetical protein
MATTTSVVAGLVAQEVVKVAAERVRYRRELAQTAKLHRKSEKIRGCLPALTRLGRTVLSKLHKRERKGPMRAAVDRDTISKDYLVRHRDRVLSTFRNAFINLATPMLAFAQPQEAEQSTLHGRQFTLWDTIQVCSILHVCYCLLTSLTVTLRQVPETVRELSLAALLQQLAEEHHVEADTVSWGDTLLYASFAQDSTVQPLDKPLLEVMLRATATEQGARKALDGLKQRLRGKEFVLLHVTGRSMLDGPGNGADVAVPAIKVMI